MPEISDTPPVDAPANEEKPPAAFAHPVSESGDTDQIREAGPEGMRDQPGQPGERWDRVDEDSDESFPASDPPATY